MRERGGAVFGDIGLPGLGDNKAHKEKKSPPPIACVLLFMSFVYNFGSAHIKHSLEGQDYSFIGLDLKFEGTILFIEYTLGLLAVAIMVDSYIGKYYVLLIGCLCFIIVPSCQLIARWGYSSVNFHRKFTEVAFYLNSSFGLLAGVRYAWFVDQMDMVKGGHAQENYLFLFAFSHVFGHFAESAVSVVTHHFHLALKYSYMYLTVIMFFHLCIFVAVRRKVINKAVYVHVVFKMVAVVYCAIKNYIKRDKEDEPEDDWLDYAAGNYSYNLVDTTKRFLRLMPMFFPLMWYGIAKSFLDSVWHHQLDILGVAERKTFVISSPEFCERLMVVCLLPTMHFYVIPLMNKRFNFLVTDLQCLCNSYLMLALSVTATLIFQHILDTNRTLYPAAGYGQFRLYNAVSGNTSVVVRWFGNISIPPLEVVSGLLVWTRDLAETNIDIQNQENNLFLTSKVFVKERESQSYIITERGLEQINVEDPLTRPQLDKSDKARMFLISSLEEDKQESRVVVELKSKESTKLVQHAGGNSLVFFGLSPTQYELTVISYNGTTKKKFTVSPRATYTILIYDKESPAAKVFKTLEQPYRISMYFMIPQWMFHALALACGEVALTRFAYTQFPEHLRTVICTCILFGNERTGEFLSYKVFTQNFRADSFMSLLVLTIHFIFLFFFMYLSLNYIYVFNFKRRVTVGDFFLLRGMG